VVKVSLFFNGVRGLKVFNYLTKKNNIQIQNIFLAKKFLDREICKDLKKRKIKFKLINMLQLHEYLRLDKHDNDLNIFCGFPYIVKNNCYNLTKYGSINLHAGKLPKYRGGSPLNWQIINGEKKIYISTIKMSKGIDTGKIIKEYSFKLYDKDTIKTVHEKCNKIFPKITYQSIQKIIDRKKLKKQSYKTKYFKQRSFKDGKINWKKNNSTQIYNFVRAITYPYHCAYTFFDKKIYFIPKCEKIEKKYNLDNSGDFIGTDNSIIVKTKNKYIKFYNANLYKKIKKLKVYKFD
tara:strand:- start:1580 stop:2455 length:876 start_codon:yes stop_codon:yes gene_type:complete